MCLPPSVRRLSLAELDQQALEELVRRGEDLLVERKQDLPKPPGFGAAAGSLANALGGWIVVGVADDGTVVGWEKPARLGLQSHLGNVLRAQVDPLPFLAAMRDVDGRPIAVVRVFPSADSPHIVRGTGPSTCAVPRGSRWTTTARSWISRDEARTPR